MVDSIATADLDWVIKLVSEIRGLRSEMNVPAAAMIPAVVREPSRIAKERLQAHGELIRRLARLSAIELEAQVKGAVQLVIEGATILLVLAGHVDVERERARLTKEIERAKSEAEKIEKKLANEAFVAKAAPEVVEDQREKLAEMKALIAKLAGALDRLTSL
jgi:valyl-tRNA synthetase